MKASKEEMKKEALERIKILGLLENVYNEFEQNDILNVSYYGALYYLTDEICSEYGSIGIKPWMGGLLRTD